MTNFDALKRMAAEQMKRAEPTVECSPARKAETGRIRNVKAMSDRKLLDLSDEMDAWSEKDKEAFEVVKAEVKRRLSALD